MHATSQHHDTNASLYAMPQHHEAVADPGFPVGGAGPRRGAWTLEAATFCKICMSKRKNRVP